MRLSLRSSRAPLLLFTNRKNSQHNFPSKQNIHNNRNSSKVESSEFLFLKKTHAGKTVPDMERYFPIMEGSTQEVH